MNCVTELEPDYSEFVEVDPTGRYGRVIFLFFLALLLCFLHFLLTVFGLLFCSTMKFLAKELPRQCTRLFCITFSNF